VRRATWRQVVVSFPLPTFCSQRTVKNVMHGLTSRLHLRNQAHAVAYALREGYI
jgi:DNA-binding NarL/FixJ family response regulator